jgi:predicted  nucleic acid-binding Zn-ribbon protein
VEVLEREQRQIKSDPVGLQNELEATRANLADTRANLQQLQREFSSLKERIEESSLPSGTTNRSVQPPRGSEGKGLGDNSS